MDGGKQTFVLFLSRTKLFPPFPRFLRSSGEFLISWEKWKRKYTTKRRGGYFGKRREYFIARVWMGKTCRVKYLFCSSLYRPHPCTPVPRSSTVYISVVASKMSESWLRREANSAVQCTWCCFTCRYRYGENPPILSCVLPPRSLCADRRENTQKIPSPLFRSSQKIRKGGMVVSHKIPFFPG